VLTVAFCTLKSLDRKVQTAALLLELLDDLVNVHAGMLTLGTLMFRVCRNCVLIITGTRRPRSNYFGGYKILL
jgi:hypothetical protein